MSEESQTAGGEKPASQGGVRRVLLLVILALLIVAIVYDYQVARPAVAAAYDDVAAANVKANATANDILTNDEVQELLGKSPSETFMDGNQNVEVFHWTGGLIVKPHKLYTVYTKNGDQWMLVRHSKFAYDSVADVQESPEIVLDPEDDPMDAMEPMDQPEPAAEPQSADQPAPAEPSDQPAPAEPAESSEPSEPTEPAESSEAAESSEQPAAADSTEPTDQPAAAEPSAS